jgi:phosphoribosyl 1,2-cyclic phosphodiesterase
VRFCSLGSGSRGNATVVDAGGTRLLIDCGFSRRELEKRLARAGLSAGGLDAILLTHEHADHVRGVGAVARRYGIPVWSTAGTWRAAAAGELADVRLFTPHGGDFRIGDVRVRPYAVPHDAREPAQFVLDHGARRLGVLTDAGSLTPHIVESLRGLDALVLECNHDPVMLANGPYPPSLQARVRGRLGHLSNAQAAALLARLDHARLQRVVAAHLSEKNNHPDLARAALCGVSEALAPRLSLLTQDQVSAWFTV